MGSAALTADGRPIDAQDFHPTAWQVMQAAWTPSSYRMPCCGATAVLKTSINGFQFFAHVAGECATAPETVWHLAGKASVVAALASLGVQANQEVSGTSPMGRWEADVLFEYEGRRIAIELQRSSQTLKEYIRRQERYASAGVECYWLTTDVNFATFSKASFKLRWTRDLGGVYPADGVLWPFIADLPIAMLNLDEAPYVAFGALKSAPLKDWLAALLARRYAFDNGLWLIRA